MCILFDGSEHCQVKPNLRYNWKDTLKVDNGYFCPSTSLDVGESLQITQVPTRSAGTFESAAFKIFVSKLLADSMLPAITSSFAHA